MLKSILNRTDKPRFAGFDSSDGFSCFRVVEVQGTPFLQEQALAAWEVCHNIPERGLDNHSIGLCAKACSSHSFYRVYPSRDGMAGYRVCHNGHRDMSLPNSDPSRRH